LAGNARGTSHAACCTFTWMLNSERLQVIALTVVVLLVGCKGDKIAKLRPLIVVSPGDALTLDPAEATDSESMQIITKIYEPLVRYKDNSSEVEGALATKWTVDKSGTIWTFKLRKRVRFHDGSPFNADAVVFTFERQRNRKHAYHSMDFPYWENTFRNIVATKKVDAHTVSITIKKPFAPFLANLAMFPVSIVSPTAVKKHSKNFRNHPVGTGPYRLLRWNKGSLIALAHNKRYWGGKPHVERLVFKVVPDASDRLSSLLSGTASVVHGLSPQDRQIVQLHPELSVHRTTGNNISYLALNTSRAPFNNLRVRQAVNHAVNKAALVKLIYQGLALPARGPIPPSMWGYRRDITDYKFDPQRARKLLRESGHQGNVPLRLYTSSTPRPYMPSPVLAAKMIANNLMDIGLDIEIVIKPLAEHFRAIRKGEHDLCLLGWVGDNGDPDNFLYVLLDSDNATFGTAQNVAFFRHQGVHDLLAKAQTESRRKNRVQIYTRVQSVIADQAPWVPLAHTQVVVAASKRVKGLQIQPSHEIRYRRVRVKD
jgi:peptide/nickel transport system substrate-binding protein